MAKERRMLLELWLSLRLILSYPVQFVFTSEV